MPEERDPVTGRLLPFKWTEEIESDIFELVSMGRSLRQIFEGAERAEHFPSRSVFERRLGSEDAAFVDRYLKAKACSAHSWDERKLDVAMNGSKDYKLKLSNGRASVEIDKEAIRRSELIYKAMSERCSQLQPKIYGKVEQVKLSDPNGEPVKFIVERIGAKQ